MRLVAILALGVLLAGPLAAAEEKKSKETKPEATHTRPAAPAAPAASAEPAARPAPPPSPALEKWIDVCVQNLASDEGAIKNGAIAALRVAGPSARPRLEKAAKSDNAKIASAAEKILAGTDRQEHQVEVRERRGDEANDPILSLKLTDEQRPQVAKILGEFRTKQDEITQSARKGELPRDQATAKLAALRQDMDKKLSGILTEQQLKQYRESKQPETAAR